MCKTMDIVFRLTWKRRSPEHPVTRKPVIRLKVKFHDMTAVNIVAETAQLNQ